MGRSAEPSAFGHHTNRHLHLKKSIFLEETIQDHNPSRLHTLPRSSKRNLYLILVALCLLAGVGRAASSPKKRNSAGDSPSHKKSAGDSPSQENYSAGDSP